MREKVLMWICFVLVVIAVTVVIIFFVRTYGIHPSMPGPRVDINQQNVVI